MLLLRRHLKDMITKARSLGDRFVKSLKKLAILIHPTFGEGAHTILLFRFVAMVTAQAAIKSDMAFQGSLPQGCNYEGAKESGAPLNKNFALLKCPACPPKLPFPLRQVQDDGFFFFWKPTEN